MPFLHIAKGLPSCLPSSSLVVNFQSIGANFRQKVAKVNIYLLDFVSPREFRRQQTAKFKIYLDFEDCRGFRCGSLFGAVVVSTCGRWSALVARPLLLWCVPCLLSSPLLCLWCIASEYGFISRFKGVFRGFYGEDVYLYGLRSLR